MRGKWLVFVRRTHLYLSVFFSPLLLIFIISGWWQTVTDSDSQQAPAGFFNNFMGKLSSVHTEGTWPEPNAHHHAWVMKYFAVAMCIALIVSIVLGLCMAWQAIKSKWRVATVFALGILTPVLVLYFF